MSRLITVEADDEEEEEVVADKSLVAERVYAVLGPHVRTRHASLEAAIRYASARARKAPGEKYFVMVPSLVVCVDEVPVSIIRYPTTTGGE